MTTATDSPPLALPEVLLDSPAFLMLQLLRRGRKRAEASPKGPQLHQMAVLAALAEFGPQSQRDLGRRLGIDPSDMVAVIDALEAEGHAVRERDPADRRRHAVAATDAGREWLAGITDGIPERSRFLLPGLTADERAQVTALLRRSLLAEDAA